MWAGGGWRLRSLVCDPKQACFKNAIIAPPQPGMQAHTSFPPGGTPGRRPEGRRAATSQVNKTHENLNFHLQKEAGAHCCHVSSVKTGTSAPRRGAVGRRGALRPTFCNAKRVGCWLAFVGGIGALAGTRHKHTMRNKCITIGARMMSVSFGGIGVGAARAL